MSELRGLGAVHEELAKRGGRVIAVATDPPERAREVIQRNRLKFSILSDIDVGVTRAYGVKHAGGGESGNDIAIPSHFLIDRDGRIVWRRVAVRIQDRPDPRTIVDVIRRQFGA